MIRINLLGQDRQKKKAAVPLLDPSRRVPLGAMLIVLVTVGGAGAWYWSLDQTSKQLDRDIVSTQQQADRMKPVLAEVQAFEQRRAQLQQRVALIEELRGGQSVPVQLLDVVSRSVPDMMWLTQLDQKLNEVTIEGRSTTLIALSDFVGNLGASPLLQKPVEIVSSQVETVPPVGPRAWPTSSSSP
jgi:type IV pilus assembly protein PilN